VQRFLLDDQATFSPKAKRFMQVVFDKERAAALPAVALVECVYILEKFYRVPRSDIADNLSRLLTYPEKLKLWAWCPFKPVGIPQKRTGNNYARIMRCVGSQKQVCEPEGMAGETERFDDSEMIPSLRFSIRKHAGRCFRVVYMNSAG